MYTFLYKLQPITTWGVHMFNGTFAMTNPDLISNLHLERNTVRTKPELFLWVRDKRFRDLRESESWVRVLGNSSGLVFTVFRYSGRKKWALGMYLLHKAECICGEIRPGSGWVFDFKFQSHC